MSLRAFMIFLCLCAQIYDLLPSVDEFITFFTSVHIFMGFFASVCVCEFMVFLILAVQIYEALLSACTNL